MHGIPRELGCQTDISITVAVLSLDSFFVSWLLTPVDTAKGVTYVIEVNQQQSLQQGEQMS